MNSEDTIAWIDGKIMPISTANVNIASHALHYGSSVFEGIRSYNGASFKLNDHIVRFFKSAELLGFQIPFTEQAITKALQQLIIENNFTDKEAYIRPIAWCGTDKLTVGNKDIDIHAAILMWERKLKRDSRQYTEGIRMHLSRWCRPSPRSSPVQSKAAGLYLIATMSRVEAERKGFDDAVLLDDRNFVSEASSSNIFIIKDSVISTSLPISCLNGITRQTVISIAKKLGYTVLERDIKVGEILNADEMFLTGTAIELMPVREFSFEKGSKIFNDQKITRKLMQLFTQATTLTS